MLAFRLLRLTAVCVRPQAVWRHEIVADGVRFEYDSPDGEGGFPGALAVKVRVCACVRERERERENVTMADSAAEYFKALPTHLATQASRGQGV